MFKYDCVLTCNPGAIEGSALTQSRHVRIEWKTWGKKLLENDKVIGNWPRAEATEAIPVLSPKIGDSLADDLRAIILAILEQDEEQRLYVRKRPEGIRPADVPVLHVLIFTLTQVQIGLSNELMATASCVLRLSATM